MDETETWVKETTSMNNKVCRRRSSSSTISSMLSSLQAACTAAATVSAAVQPVTNFPTTIIDFQKGSSSAAANISNTLAFNTNASSSTMHFQTILANKNSSNYRKYSSNSNSTKISTTTANNNNNNLNNGKILWNVPIPRYGEKTGIYGKKSVTFGSAVQRAASLKYSTSGETVLNTSDSIIKDEERYLSTALITLSPKTSITSLSSALKQQQTESPYFNRSENDEPEFAVITESPMAQALSLTAVQRENYDHLKLTSLASKSLAIKSNSSSAISAANAQKFLFYSSRFSSEAEPPKDPPPPLPINLNKTPLRLLTNLKKRNSFNDPHENSLNLWPLKNSSEEYSTMSLQRTCTPQLKQQHQKALEAPQVLKEHLFNNALQSPLQSNIPLQKRINAYCQAANIQRPIGSAFLQSLQYTTKTQK